MEIDPHIFRVLGPILPILSPRKQPKLNVHFGYLPPPATVRETRSCQVATCVSMWPTGLGWWTLGLLPGTPHVTGSQALSTLQLFQNLSSFTQFSMFIVVLHICKLSSSAKLQKPSFQANARARPPRRCAPIRANIFQLLKWEVEKMSQGNQKSSDSVAKTSNTL